MASEAAAVFPARDDTDDGWTDERIERLRALWGGQLTCAQIAAELGSLSRNAVIGKARRLGLMARRRGRRPRDNEAAPLRPKSRTRAHATRIVRLRRATPFAVGHFVVGTSSVAQPSSPRGCGLLQLTEASCRWPFGDPGDPEFHFCGARSLTRRAYCPVHWRMAYRLPEAAGQQTGRVCFAGKIGEPR